MAAKQPKQQDRAETTILWTPDKQVPRRGRIEIRNPPIGYIVGYGDGMRDANVPANVYYHTYPAEGPYTLTVTPTGSQVATVFKPIRVLDALAPNATISAPDQGATIRVEFTDPPGMPVVPRYTIWWARSDHQDVTPEPGAVFERYVEAGTYPIRVLDHWSGLQVNERLTVKPFEFDPNFTLVEDTTDPERYTAQLEVTHAAAGGEGKEFVVDWGDGTDVENIAAQVGTKVSHAYDFGDTYSVVMYYADDPDQARIQSVTIPFTG